MQISTNNLLQSIQSSSKIDNSVNKNTNGASIKDKQTSTLLNLTTVTQNDQSQPKQIQDIVQNVLKQLANKETSKQNASNILKNSSVLKQTATLSNDLQNLTTMLKNEPKLVKYESNIKQFLTTIKDLDGVKLEQSIKQSGIFLESKLENLSKNTTINQPLKQLLEDIKVELKKLDTPQSKQLAKTIENIQSNPKLAPKDVQENLKQVVDQIKQIKPEQLTQNTKQIVVKIDNLNQKLQQSIPKIDTTQIENNPQLNKETKELLNEIKQTINRLPNVQNKNDLQNIKQTINNILDPKLENKTTQIQNSIQPKLENVNNLVQSSLKLINNIKQPINDVATQIKSSNLSVVQKQDIINIDSKVQSLVKDLNNISIENLSTKQVQNLQQKINDLLISIKQNPEIKANLQNINPMTQSSIDNILSMPKIVPSQQSLMPTLANDISSNIKNVVDMIKQNITKPSNNNLSQPANQKADSFPILQLANKLETLLSAPVQNSAILTTTNQEITKQVISNDLKAVLLQLQDDIKSTQNIDSANTKEIIKQVDKLIGQIEYFQALSYANATQSTFLPFIWDSMQEGEISFKKLKEDKFFVQINLKLKEYGKLDLMVILHDKNQLDISMFTQKDELKQKVQDNIQSLKYSINKSGLIATNIRLLDLQKDDEIKTKTNNFVQEQQIGHGISIKV
jgi:hypothetical protein